MLCLSTFVNSASLGSDVHTITVRVQCTCNVVAAGHDLGIDDGARSFGNDVSHARETIQRHGRVSDEPVGAI